MTIIEQRHTRITVGPPGASGRVWDQRYYIKCSVERSGASTPNKAKVEIYNLAPASLAYLERPGHVMQVQVGVGVPGTIFYGQLRKKGIATKISHPNQITTLQATDGKLVMQEAYFAGSYPAGVTRTQILADALAANAVPTGYIYPLPERVYQAAVAFAAPLPTVLDELYAGESATWSLQSGRFVLMHDDIAAPGNALIISSATGMIGSPERTDKGIKVKTSQVGVVYPGAPIVVQSRLVNGTYKVSKATAKWDTELQWEDKIVGTVIK